MPVATEEPVTEVACEMAFAGEKWDDHQRNLQIWVKPSINIQPTIPGTSQNIRYQSVQAWNYEVICGFLGMVKIYDFAVMLSFCKKFCSKSKRLGYFIYFHIMWYPKNFELCLLGMDNEH